MTEDGLTIQRMVSARVPAEAGEFTLCLYTNNKDNKEHLALVRGDVRGKKAVLARVHSECFTGDVLGSRRCDCGEQLNRAISMIAMEDCGVIVYLRQEGRGIGLLAKLQAYNLQDEAGLDTVDANLALGHAIDDRDYSVAAEILKDLGVESLRMLTNNPTKVTAMERNGIQVDERISMLPTVYPDNYYYLLTKVQRMNHLMNLTILPRG